VYSIDPLVASLGDLVTVVLTDVTEDLVQNVTVFMNGDTVVAPVEVVWNGSTGAWFTFDMPSLRVDLDGSTTMVVRLGSDFQLAQQTMTFVPVLIPEFVSTTPSSGSVRGGQVVSVMLISVDSSKYR
jgi:hypothetical protein